ncbi:MAG: hypothetical protein ACI91F_002466 [Candidatus Binatia bacterium]
MLDGFKSYGKRDCRKAACYRLVAEERRISTFANRGSISERRCRGLGYRSTAQCLNIATVAFSDQLSDKHAEGADQPLVPSIRSVAYGRVNQLRDPAVFVDGDRTFLHYALAGESGIGIAQLDFNT